MNSNLIIFIILTILFLSITIFLQKTIKDFTSEIKDSVQQNYKRLIELPNFYYDIYFNAPPTEINVTNPYECTAKDLKWCKLSDPTSCIGCKNLIASCTHISQNMDFIAFDGTKTYYTSKC